MDFDDLPTDAPPKPRRQRRPWWRWNLITLAVTLFVLLWTSELARLSPGRIWTTVALIFGVWWLAPSLVVGRWPWPLSVLMELTVDSDKYKPMHPAAHRSRAAGACRFMAKLVFLGAIVQAGFLVWLMLNGAVSGGFGFGAQFVFLGVVPTFWTIVQSLALGIGLRTLGAIVDALEKLTLELARRVDE